MKLTTQMEIDMEDIVRAYPRKDVLDFILQIDLEYADVDFTENLIVELIKTLQCDLSEYKWGPYQQLLDSVEKNVNKL